ncbi:hypothetical protein [Tenacibaculum amylolyticum]|uniref:hypothetical protein n=1 Tax=Tenacibaculum amylolyticum TaxID=104269 RepID=UPI003893C7EE
MRRSIINLLKQIEDQLSKVSLIADLLEKKSTSSSKVLKDWLLETENILQQNNRPESSLLSAKRGELVAFYPKSKQNKKKEQLRFTAGVLSGSQNDLWDVYQKLAEVTENAKTLIKQLLGIIYQSKQFKYDAKVDFTMFLQSMWKFCTEHEQLRGVTSQVLSMINTTDVLIILAEEIEVENL